MDDPVLARARLLLSLANGGGGANEVPSSTEAPPAPSRRLHQAAAAAPLFDLASQTPGPLPPGSYSVTVIRGSRLLSTQCDVRPHVKRGAAVKIDGVAYALSVRPNCEFSANRLELADDYHGDTRAGAILTIDGFVRRSPTKKKSNTMEPVPSGDIRAALAALDRFDPASGISQRYSSSIKPPSSVVKKLANKVSSVVPATTEAEYIYRGPSAPAASGGYLHNLQQQSRAADRLHEAENRAMQRVARKHKEDAAEMARRQKEEKEAAEFLHIAMENKARLLQEKTAARVALLHSAKAIEDRQNRLDLEAQLRKKMQSENVAQSEDHKMRMLQLTRETKQRLEISKRNEECRRQHEKEQMAKKLSDISEFRRRNDHGLGGSVRRRERGRGNENRPKTDDTTTLQRIESDLGSLLDNHHDDRYSKEYAAFRGERISRSMQEQRYSYTVEVPGDNAKDNSNKSNNNNDDDDDDDGYWSNDSLDDVGQLPAYETVAADDEMTACSAVTLGSPPKKQPQPRHSSLRAPRLKLKPIAVRPYVPVPQQI